MFDSFDSDAGCNRWVVVVSIYGDGLVLDRQDRPRRVTADPSKGRFIGALVIKDLWVNPYVNRLFGLLTAVKVVSNGSGRRIELSVGKDVVVVNKHAGGIVAVAEGSDPELNRVEKVLSSVKSLLRRIQ